MAWTLRVGNYRLVCDIQDGELVVLMLQVAHLSESYHLLDFQGPADLAAWLATIA